MSKDIICINVGQAGIQISNSCWELFCIEHGLDCSGMKMELEQYVGGFIGDDPLRSNMDTFFHETRKGNYVPRSISVDLEPSVIDEIRSGAYRNLWNPEYLLSGIEDASNNFGRGYISIGKTMIERFMDTLAKLVENCEHLHGIFFFHSYSGGTGSGFTDLILNNVTNLYAKVTNIASAIFPSPQQSTAIVEPYNCLLSAATSLYSMDVVLMTDNECLYNLCSNKLLIQSPSYNNVNRLLSQLFSSLTVTIRFQSSLDHDIVHLQTNLIPFPRIHFPISTFCPLLDESKTNHESLTVQEITHQLFDEENKFISCDVSVGKYMACCLHYRGLVKPRDINNALLEIKKRRDIEFVDWSPVGFKVGISPMPPASVINSDVATTNINCSMFFNSTAIEKVWDVIHKKFNVLFKKRAFFHWFIGEGMEESEFLDCESDIMRLQKDYKEIEDQTDDWFEEKYKQKTELVEGREEENVKSLNATDLIDSWNGDTNNNLPIECESQFSNISLFKCIKKVTFSTSSIDSNDVYKKNRQLLKLFQDCAD